MAFINELLDALSVEMRFNGEYGTITLKVGPITIEDIPIGKLFSLSRSAFIEKLVSEIFIIKRVMWESYEKEDTRMCVMSLQDQSSILNNYYKELSNQWSIRDKNMATLLLALACETSLGAKNLHDSLPSLIELDRDPANSGFEVGEGVLNDEKLSEIRAKSYGYINCFIQMLDKENPIRKQAESKMAQGMQTIDQKHIIHISRPLWEPKCMKE